MKILKDVSESGINGEGYIKELVKKMDDRTVKGIIINVNRYMNLPSSLYNEKSYYEYLNKLVTSLPTSEKMVLLNFTNDYNVSFSMKFINFLNKMKNKLPNLVLHTLERKNLNNIKNMALQNGFDISIAPYEMKGCITDENYVIGTMYDIKTLQQRLKNNEKVIVYWHSSYSKPFGVEEQEKYRYDFERFIKDNASNPNLIVCTNTNNLPFLVTTPLPEKQKKKTRRTKSILCY
ncbi:MAG: hypothetical protein Q4G04_05930 [bacterium]|nr:hypothetical protein [bacterium]